MMFFLKFSTQTCGKVLMPGILCLFLRKPGNVSVHTAGAVPVLCAALMQTSADPVVMNRNKKCQRHH